MMNCALCLSGYSAQLPRYHHGLNEDRKVLDKSYEYYYRNIFNDNDVDVFIHTWESKFTDLYLKYFQPKQYLVEKQIDVSKFLPYKSRFRPENECYAIPPKAYAIKKVIELLDGEYDLVILSRPDVCWLTPFKPKEHIPSLLYIMDSVTFKHRQTKAIINYINVLKHKESEIKRVNRGYPVNPIIADFVFTSSPETIKLFGTIYDNLLSYIKQDLRPFTKSGTFRYHNHNLYLWHLIQHGVQDKITVKYKWMRDITLTRNFLGMKS